MTQIQWQQLEAVGEMTDEEKQRLAALLHSEAPKLEKRPDRVLGLFADEPELIDEVMKIVYHDRETQS